MSFIDKLNRYELKSKQIVALELLLIIGFAAIPLLSSFPYRVNIFLSWEGAYRLYLGQIPFKDYGIPMGYGYWLIPAMFFKIFGPYMLSLIKAQVFINILAGLSFRSILKSFKVNTGLRLVGILLFIISYSFFNFWPWYNHTVIVYELIGLAFLLRFIFSGQVYWKRLILLSAATLLLFLSFFTKQDGGGLAFMLSFFLVVYHAIVDKKYIDIVSFLALYAIWACVFIMPVASYDFGYWFNLGQEPHNSRIHLLDFIKTAFGESKWEKFYISAMIFVLLIRLKDFKAFITDKQSFLFFLLTLGILVEALIFQVTSYTPPDNNIFFHSFAFVYLFSLTKISQHFNRLPQLIIMVSLIMLWWSGVYWKYVERKMLRMFPAMAQVDDEAISKSTYMVSERIENNINMSEWGFSKLRAFKGIYMPQSTVEGMQRLMQMEEVKNHNPNVLNMTELTPLAYEIGFELRKNKPLWYHKGVGMFQREVDQYVAEIKNQEYDVVLFETIPYLNNFFPEEVYGSLIENYQMVDRFLAPRRPTDSHIEVYIRKAEKNSDEETELFEVNEQVETQNP
ncbi:MAG: hypothetical protein ACI8Q1_002270 [Parvicella sp.]|jgi:hypothetical protein